MKILLIFSATTLLLAPMQAQHPDGEGGVPDGCTTITAGKKATADGSGITPHTRDSPQTRSWVGLGPAQKHDQGSPTPLYRRVPSDSFAMPPYPHIPTGYDPQVRETLKHINTD